MSQMVSKQRRHQVERPVTFGQRPHQQAKQVELLSARPSKSGWKAAAVPRTHAYESHSNRSHGFDGEGLLAPRGHGEQAVSQLREFAAPAIKGKGSLTARAM